MRRLPPALHLIMALRLRQPDGSACTDFFRLDVTKCFANAVVCTV
jgi:hypothetical protein